MLQKVSCLEIVPNSVLMLLNNDEAMQHESNCTLLIL